MTVYHSGRACTLTLPGPELGYQVHKTSEGVAGTWWRGPWPSSPGVAPITCTNVWAYRAINSAGTIWPGGPTNYAQSLINLENPGTNDLTAPAGNPAWAAATGWSFVAAQARYLETGLTVAVDQSWSMFVQYANNVVLNSGLCGSADAVAYRFWLSGDFIGFGVLYSNGGYITVLPGLVTGNVGIAGNQGYRNGLAEGAAIGGAAGPAPGTITIGSAGGPGPTVRFCTAEVRAACFMDCTTTAPQALALATAMGEL